MCEVVHCGDVVIVGLKSNIWINVPMWENKELKWEMSAKMLENNLLFIYIVPFQHLRLSLYGAK